MKSFLNKLEQAAAAPAESKRTVPPTRWDPVLDTFIGFLNRKYADALRVLCKGRAAYGFVHLMVRPRGRRNYRITLLVFHFTERSARILDDDGYDIESPSALEQRFIELVRTKMFRSIVKELHEVSNQPVTGLIHTGGLRKRHPTTDILVTISADEQGKLEAASEITRRKRITLRAHLAEPEPSGQGIYAPGATLRWLVAGGYGLKLDRNGHVLEDGDVIRLSGTPIDPVVLE